MSLTVGVVSVGVSTVGVVAGCAVGGVFPFLGVGCQPGFPGLPTFFPLLSAMLGFFSNVYSVFLSSIWIAL